MSWLRRKPRVAAEDRDERLARIYGERVAEQDRSRPGYAAAWASFTEKLLTHGGTHVVPPLAPDPLIDMLRTEGRIKTGTSELLEGEPSECHRNVVALWRAGQATAIGTGYALSDDGLWREHSWGIAPNHGVIETTEERLQYFGVSMEGDRAEWFADWIDRD